MTELAIFIALSIIVVMVLYRSYKYTEQQTVIVGGIYKNIFSPAYVAQVLSVSGDDVEVDYYLEWDFGIRKKKRTVIKKSEFFENYSLIRKE